jgi:MGT family glycosyltransferase
MSQPPTIAFFPEASFGAALNCVAIAQALERHGAVPVFICHPGFTGVFADYGFKEVHLPTVAQTGDAADYWQAFINRHLPHFDLSPQQQLSTYVGPTWEAIVDTVIAADATLERALAQIRPDVIVLDNVIMFPAIAHAGCPWVRVISCAETELPDNNVPPYLSGMSADDPGRAEFGAAYRSATARAHRRITDFRRTRGLPALPAGQFIEPSPRLNLLLSPEVVRYNRAKPPDPATHRYLQGCVRDEAQFDQLLLPNHPGPLVYVSFGSLGAIDVALIDRMIEVFATIRARFVVSVGGFTEAYSNVPDNVVLGSWFPQPSIVARCDLFIHHGGNNSFCEALFYGVPSLIMPYCWDGHDNAMRATETGVGRALSRSSWSKDDLKKAIEGLLTDQSMRRKLEASAAAMRQNPGTETAAAAIMGLLPTEHDTTPVQHQPSFAG